jgi:hypothetical protein
MTALDAVVRTVMRLLLIAAPFLLVCASCQSKSPDGSGSGAAKPATTTPPSGAATATPTNALDVGSVAPDFALQGSDGKVHRLADDRGKRAVVLAWFPKAFTGG